MERAPDYDSIREHEQPVPVPAAAVESGGGEDHVDPLHDQVRYIFDGLTDADDFSCFNENTGASERARPVASIGGGSEPQAAGENSGEGGSSAANSGATASEHQQQQHGHAHDEAQLQAGDSGGERVAASGGQASDGKGKSKGKRKGHNGRDTDKKRSTRAAEE